jgi:hypothetical protein
MQITENRKKELKLLTSFMIADVNHGKPWYTMVYHGKPWYNMVYHGIPWYTIVNHGK